MAVNGFSSIYQSLPRQSLLRKLSSFRLDNKRRADFMAPDIMLEKEWLQIFAQLLKSFGIEESYSKGACGVRDVVSIGCRIIKASLKSCALYQ